MKLVDKGIEGTGMYPLGDRHREQKFGPLQTIGAFDNSIVAVPSGEKRKPKKGEWYLSGAKVAAYQEIGRAHV